MRVNCVSPSAISWVATAEQGLNHDGYTILDNALPLSTVDKIRSVFFDRYSNFYGPEEAKKSQLHVQNVGDNRWMIPIELSHPFDDPVIYANPFVLNLLRRVLGKNVKIDNFGAVLALAGAKDQHIHTDGRSLFQSPIDGLLPPHAITVAIPLVEMNTLHGTTALWKGTHRKPHPRPEDIKATTPIVPLGSCLLWDYRLQHSGTANNSCNARPILYITYARIWYQDPFDYGKCERLKIPFGFLDTLPQNLQSLFAHISCPDSFQR